MYTYEERIHMAINLQRNVADASMITNINTTIDRYTLSLRHTDTHWWYQMNRVNTIIECTLCSYVYCCYLLYINVNVILIRSINSY